MTLVLGAWQKEYYRSALGVNVEDERILWIDLALPSYTRYGWYLWNLPRLARSLNVDIVHFLHPLPVIKRLFHCPVVLTIHDLYAYDEPGVIGYPNLYLNRLVIRSSIRASTEIVSISQFTQERLLHWFPHLRERMMLPVIYQSVSINKPEIPTNPLGYKFLLCVAQHRIHKNLDLVIESHSRAIARGVIAANTKLLIVGSEGPATRDLHELARKVPGVVFLDTISDGHLAFLYSACEFYICASSIEGFCLPLVEAMLFACRVVCSDIPVLKEVAGDDATYFELQNHDPDALLEAIQTALATVRHVGRSRAFTERLGDKWADVYNVSRTLSSNTCRAC